MPPRVVVGVPLYQHAAYLPEAIETLVAQTFADVAFVLCDDGSEDGSVEIARRYAAADARIHVEVNADRLGLVGNWWHAFERARALHPAAPYFAWGSDHDAWHPRFLDELVAALEANPAAVLAYPRNVRVDEHGAVIREPWADRDTAGLSAPADRVAEAYRTMVPGDMVYGVMRADALARAGFRHVLVPDRLLLTELALQGEFVQVPQILWRRRFRHPVTAERQRRAFFPAGAPTWSRLPWWVPHAWWLLRHAIGGPVYPSAPRPLRVRIALSVSRQAAVMYARGQVNLWVNRLGAELARPRSRAVGVTLALARRAYLLLRGRTA